MNTQPIEWIFEQIAKTEKTNDSFEFHILLSLSLTLYLEKGWFFL